MLIIVEATISFRDFLEASTVPITPQRRAHGRTGATPSKIKKNSRGRSDSDRCTALLWPSHCLGHLTRMDHARGCLPVPCKTNSTPTEPSVSSSPPMGGTKRSKPGFCTRRRIGLKIAADDTEAAITTTETAQISDANDESVPWWVREYQAPPPGHLGAHCVSVLGSQAEMGTSLEPGASLESTTTADRPETHRHLSKDSTISQRQEQERKADPESHESELIRTQFELGAFVFALTSQVTQAPVRAKSARSSI